MESTARSAIRNRHYTKQGYFWRGGGQPTLVDGSQKFWPLVDVFFSQKGVFFRNFRDIPTNNTPKITFHCTFISDILGETEPWGVPITQNSLFWPIEQYIRAKLILCTRSQELRNDQRAEVCGNTFENLAYVGKYSNWKKSQNMKCLWDKKNLAASSAPQNNPYISWFFLLLQLRNNISKNTKKLNFSDPNICFSFHFYATIFLKKSLKIF